MDSSGSPFAVNEYVERWLAELDSELGVKIQALDTRRRQAKRSPPSSLDQNSEPWIRKRPHKHRKDGRNTTHKTSVDDGDLPTNAEVENEGKFIGTKPKLDSPKHQAQDYIESPTSKIPLSRSKDAEDPSNKYARKSRHKIKLDRYEYKGGVANLSSGKQIAKGDITRNRRKKTGDNLNQEFKAANVEQERLTLKPAVRPGIFGKAKASALQHTGGLPDLTFSEMKFLSKKRQPELTPSSKQQKRNPRKSMEKSKEISEFFANAKGDARMPRQTSHNGRGRQHPSDLTDWSHCSANSSSARLVSRNELSLVTSKHSHDKSISTDEISRRGTAYNAFRTSGDGDHSKIVAIQKDESAKSPEPIANTSCSWSITPLKTALGEQVVENFLHTEQNGARLDFQQKLGSRRESSITNSSLDRHIKRVLLDRDSELRLQSQRRLSDSKFFSLDDLKDLARIAEIEEKYSSLPDISLQHERSFGSGSFMIPPHGPPPSWQPSEFQARFWQGGHQRQDLRLGAERTSKACRIRQEYAPCQSLHLRDDEHSHATLPKGEAAAMHPMPEDSRQGEQEWQQNRPREIFETEPRHSLSYPQRILQRCSPHQVEMGGSVNGSRFAKADGGLPVDELDDKEMPVPLPYAHERTAQEASELVMSGLDDADALCLWEYDGNLECNLWNRNTPDMSGLGHEHESIERERVSEDQYLDTDLGQTDMVGGGKAQDATEHYTLGDSHQPSIMWNRWTALQTAESPPEEFQGLSRPQILY